MGREGPLIRAEVN